MKQSVIEARKKAVRNRFELVVLVSQRARDLNVGSKPLLNKFSNDDKSIILALEEMSTNLFNPEELRRLVIRRHKINTIDFGYTTDSFVDKQGLNQFDNIKDAKSDIFFGDDDVESQD
ncbi:MAG: DNA-directed RNA polymerase subunit omega [Rickettsiaceae bacterium H1]|nr:DNA-directed RNA polymerase subunit omega [Rickettsiaceae bacterium H1]